MDSSVAAALLAQAVGRQLTCVFVDHGLMRKDEGDEVEAAFQQWDINFIRVDAEKRFLDKLKDISDPERKRKIIGEEFIRVFEEEAKKLSLIHIFGVAMDHKHMIRPGSIGADPVQQAGKVGVGGQAVELDDPGIDCDLFANCLLYTSRCV